MQTVKAAEWTMSSEIMDITVAAHLCGLDHSILAITFTTLSALTFM